LGIGGSERLKGDPAARQQSNTPRIGMEEQPAGAEK
jgi:hypothetical protein